MTKGGDTGVTWKLQLCEKVAEVMLMVGEIVRMDAERDLMVLRSILIGD